MCFGSFVFRSGSISWLSRFVKGFWDHFAGDPKISFPACFLRSTHPRTAESYRLTHPLKAAMKEGRKVMGDEATFRWQYTQAHTTDRSAYPAWMKRLSGCDSRLIMSHSNSLVKGSAFWPSLTVPTVGAGSLRCLRDNEAYYAIGKIGCQEVFNYFL